MVTVRSHAAAATSSDLQTDVLLQPILSQIANAGGGGVPVGVGLRDKDYHT